VAPTWPKGKWRICPLEWPNAHGEWRTLLIFAAFAALTCRAHVQAGMFYGNLRHYLKKAAPSPGVHMVPPVGRQAPGPDAGEFHRAVRRFLDHSSLAVTTTYLRRMEGR
jgi:hypothetical protein